MSIKVKRVRVLRNMGLLAAFSLSVLWLGHSGLPQQSGALGSGLLAGIACGALYWWRLRRRIQRRQQRHARNRIFVRFISPVEFIMAAIASSHILLLMVLSLLMLMLLTGLATGHAWTLFLGGLGLTSALATGAGVLRYEWHSGPLYYQYASTGWGGGESLLYQRAVVTEPLNPEGRISISGTLWQARSMDNQTIAEGEIVEVLDREGLTLFVAPA